MTTLPLLIRALLIAASFTGLCAGLRVRFALDRFVAPLAACSGVILLLTILGTVNLLEPGAYALYILGFAGLVYAYILRRSRPQWALLLAMLLFIAFLVWHFYPAKLRHNDDFSHWGLITRFMLLRNRLPVGSDGVITHQSYPPGAAAFIYYVARPLANHDGMYIVAQNFLLGALFLPVFSLIHMRRRIFYPIAAALFFTFFCYSCRDRNLLVDELQVFFAIGAAAAVIRYRDDPRRALGAGLPASVAVALVKSGGLFFSVFTGLMLIHVIRRGKLRRGKLWCAAVLAAPVLAILLWLLRVRLCFPSMETSAHAVSLTAYAQNLRGKGLAGAAQVLRAMLAAELQPTNWRMFNAAVLLLTAALLIVAARRLPKPQRGPIYRALGFAAASYITWFLMLYCMYLFSMSSYDAQTLTSFYRYITTGVEYASALTALPLLVALQREDVRFPLPLLRAASALSLLGMTGVLALLIWPGVQTPIDGFFARQDQYTDLRRRIVTLREENELPYGGRYLLSFLYDPEIEIRKFHYIRSNIAYEFGDGDPFIIAAERSAPEQQQIGRSREASDADGVLRYIAENIDGCDAFLIIDEPAPELGAIIDTFLETYDGDTPVYRAYAADGGNS